VSEIFFDVKGEPRGNSGHDKTTMILNPDFSFMKAQLAEVFGNNSGLELILDRRKRKSDRRKTRAKVAVERRSADRRGPRQHIAEVIIDL